MKKLLFMIVTVALMAACTGNTNTSGSTASDEQNDSATTEQATPGTMKEGDKGPGTLEATNFTIDVPQGWEVTTKTDEELAVRPEGGKVFSFRYYDQANYEQEKQMMMNHNGMQDNGEKQFGDNTYHLYLWKQDTDDTFKALLKIGDGTAGSMTVTCSGFKEEHNDLLPTILGNVKMK